MNAVQCGVALSGYTTLGLGGPASRFVVAGTGDELVARVRAADERGEPLLVLGGGSNLVISDDGFDGTVVRVATRGVSMAADQQTVTVAAGEDWDALVHRCVTAGLAGLECLSGIPGLTGATPIQNVGAYGQEVAGVITAVRTYDRVRREVAGLTGPHCGFGYRTSMFKRDPGRYVVLSVTFALARERLSRRVGYAELAGRLGVAVGDRVPLSDVRSAVLELRRGKGMVLDAGDPDTRSAGSFFTNPIITAEQLAGVERVARELFGDGTTVPRYPADDGLVKVPAAWLIERAGFGKGYRSGDAKISSKHTLALVNPGGGTAKGLLGLAAEIRDGVLAAFGVELAPEPVLVGVTL
ncbi:MAG TPA: UDP-N-acetylmuramate dehydrogenase [Streptosporangiaceae bacterium]